MHKEKDSKDFPKPYLHSAILQKLSLKRKGLKHSPPQVHRPRPHHKQSLVDEYVVGSVFLVV